MFKLEDFENGMVVELKCGDKRLFWEGNFIDKSGYIPVSRYNDELLNGDTINGKDDIVKIFKSEYITYFNAFFEDKKLTEIWNRYNDSESKVKEILDNIDRLMMNITTRKAEYSKIAFDEKLRQPNFSDLNWCFDQLYWLKKNNS